MVVVAPLSKPEIALLQSAICDSSTCVRASNLLLVASLVDAGLCEVDDDKWEGYISVMATDVGFDLARSKGWIRREAHWSWARESTRGGWVAVENDETRPLREDV